MNIDQIRETYDRKAERYDRTVGFTENVILGDLRREFGAQLRGRTLEVAIGTGLNLPYYSEAVTEATGVDLSAEMLEHAQERARRLERPITLRQMDAQRLEFETNSFDTVAISLALCTTPDPRQALREIARVCRPGGNVVVLEHVLAPNRLVAGMQRLWSPVQERALGCHLTRQTVALMQEEEFTIEADRSRLLGIFRLVVARPPRDRV